MIKRMGKRRRRSSRDSFWTQQYGGMPVWGLAVALSFLAAMVAIAVPAALTAPQQSSATEPRPIPTLRDEGSPAATRTKLVVLGDSYTGGSEMGGTEKAGWPAIVGKQFDWLVSLDARGGSGYLQPGIDDAPPFSGRLDAVVEAEPDILIVAGGINDAANFPAVDVGDAAAEQLGYLQSSLPDARIIVVGPFFPTSPAPETWREASASIRASAADLSLDFIDPLPWFEGNAVEIGEDGTHPTDAGHAVLAERMVDALKALGVN